MAARQSESPILRFPCDAVIDRIALFHIRKNSEGLKTGLEPNDLRVFVLWLHRLQKQEDGPPINMMDRRSQIHADYEGSIIR
jgi:hypothetical protein